MCRVASAEPRAVEEPSNSSKGSVANLDFSTLRARARISSPIRASVYALGRPVVEAGYTGRNRRWRDFTEFTNASIRTCTSKCPS